MDKKTQERLLQIAMAVNGVEKLDTRCKQMAIGYLIANTKLSVGEIRCVVNYKRSNDTTAWAIFNSHRYERDNDKEYQKRYYTMCLRMGTMNKL